MKCILGHALSVCVAGQGRHRRAGLEAKALVDTAAKIVAMDGRRRCPARGNDNEGSFCLAQIFCTLTAGAVPGLGMGSRRRLRLRKPRLRKSSVC